MQRSAARAARERGAPGGAAKGSCAHTAAVVLFAVSFCHLVIKAHSKSASDLGSYMACLCRRAGIT